MNRRNKASFSNFSGVVWRELKLSRNTKNAFYFARIYSDFGIVHRSKIVASEMVRYV